MRAGTAAHRVLRLAANNILPALLSLPFLMAYVVRLRARIEDGGDLLDISHAAVWVAFGLLTLGQNLARHNVRGYNRDPLGMLSAMGGTYLPLLLGLLPVTTSSRAALGASTLWMMLTLIWDFVARVYLGRCWGILPDARGFVCRGPYRVVRHPIYLGYLLGSPSWVIPVISPLAMFVWLACLLLMVFRTIYEEQILRSTFPTYAAYQ